MRTTIDLPADLLSELKARAAREGRTLSELVTDAARAFAVREASPAYAAADLSLPISRHAHSGVLPGVDLLDNAELLDLLEADLPLDKRR